MYRYYDHVVLEHTRCMGQVAVGEDKRYRRGVGKLVLQLVLESCGDTWCHQRAAVKFPWLTFRCRQSSLPCQTLNHLITWQTVRTVKLLHRFLYMLDPHPQAQNDRNGPSFPMVQVVKSGILLFIYEMWCLSQKHRKIAKSCPEHISSVLEVSSCFY